MCGKWAEVVVEIGVRLRRVLGGFGVSLRGLVKPLEGLVAAIRWPQCRFLGRTEGVGPMALTAVSRLVVVDGDSFLNALFAPAGQG